MQFNSMKVSGLCALAVFVVGLAGPALGQDVLWQEVQSAALGADGAAGASGIRYVVDTPRLDDILRNAPLRDFQQRQLSGAIITLPMPDGSFERFRVEEAPVFEPALAARYPTIRNYRISGVDNLALRGQLDRNGDDMHALVLTSGGPVQINPAGGHPFYTSAYEKAPAVPFECGADDAFVPPPAAANRPLLGTARNGGKGGIRRIAAAATSAKDIPSGSNLRIYELAVATTAEYYMGRGNNDGAVLASINTVFGRVNLIYESEVAIQFMVIAETDQLFSTDPTDFTNTVPATMRVENQAFIDGILDDDDYDIGHVFGTSPGGGNAAGSVVCVDGSKALGASGLNVGNNAATEEGFGGYRLVMHEVGHQFSAGHSWSGRFGNCTMGQFSPTNAYEPLSGTTIMSYSGTCGNSENINGNVAVDTYFHTRSFDSIVDYSVNDNGNNCPTIQNTSNSAPVVNAGSDFTIPARTPFTLTGSATDPESDPLTYNWEQFDVGGVRISPLMDAGDNPLFRSVIPGASPSRTFPQLADILDGTPSVGELLPQDDRTMNFRLTARDNLAAGGGVDYDSMVVTVLGDPFSLTSPNGGETLNAGCTEPATWIVGGGDIAANVNLLLSTDGGLTFPTALASSVPNDGSHDVALPCTASTSARVRAEGDGNIFFDISDDDFTIEENEPEVALESPPPEEGEVDENCEYDLQFTATITDDCSVAEADVDVAFSVLGGTAMISNGMFQTQQVNSTTVSVTGSALVSDLTSSPAIARALITVSDGCGLEEQDPYDIALFDTTPPTIDVTLSPDTLWAPNHKMNIITADVTVADNCPIANFELLSVTSNEPDNGLGDGDFPDDIQGADPFTDDVSFEVRAERMGGGDGRVYTATYQVEDGSGNTTEGSATVDVPHSQSPE